MLKKPLLFCVVLGLLLGLSLLGCSAEPEEASDESEPSGASEEQYAQDVPGLEENAEPDEGYYWEEVQSEEEEASAMESPKEDDAPAGYIPEGEALVGEPYNLIEAATEIPRNDRRYVCGYASNVFVADVLEPYSEVGLDPDPVDGDPNPTIPQSQFLVIPVSGVEQVKGSLDPANRVLADDSTTLAYIVSQIGGTGDDGLELFEGDPLLIPGERYIFATSYDADTNWYKVVIQPEGDLRVSSDEERDKKIRLLKHACHYEKTPEDVQETMQSEEALTVDEQYVDEEPDYVLRGPSEAKEEGE